MKKFLKLFPVTTYSVFVVLLALILMKDIQYDSNIFQTLLNFLIVFLGLPLIGIGQIYRFLGIKTSLPWVIPICFLLDLIILYIRKHLIPAIRGKNKKLLIPSFFKVFSKLRNGKN